MKKTTKTRNRFPSRIRSAMVDELRRKGVSAQEARAVARFAIIHGIDATADPEGSRLRTVTVRRGEGKSVKLANVKLRPGRMIEALGSTAVNVIPAVVTREPALAVLALLVAAVQFRQCVTVDLTDDDCDVLLALGRLSLDGYSPSDVELSSATGISAERVRRALKRLKEMGTVVLTAKKEWRIVERVILAEDDGLAQPVALVMKEE